MKASLLSRLAFGGRTRRETVSCCAERDDSSGYAAGHSECDAGGDGREDRRYSARSCRCPEGREDGRWQGAARLSGPDRFGEQYRHGRSEFGSRDFRTLVELGDFNPQLRAVVAVNPISDHIPVARGNGITSVVMLSGRRIIGGTGRADASRRLDVGRDGGGAERHDADADCRTIADARRSTRSFGAARTAVRGNEAAL